MDVELKPCPFCGREPELIAYSESTAVRCDNDQCIIWSPEPIPYNDHDHRTTAITAWNIRHGAGDADRSAELTTAWMAGMERERDRAARDVEDAARYRWLRLHVTDRFMRNNEHEPCLLLPHNVDYLSPDEIDAAIDAARAGERG